MAGRCGRIRGDDGDLHHGAGVIPGHFPQKRPIRPITYQIKFQQSIQIEDFLIIEFLNENSATFYLSNNLKSERIYDNVKTELLKKEFEVEYGSDIVIKGLGFINVKKRGNVNIYIKNGIEVFTRNSVI